MKSFRQILPFAIMLLTPSAAFAEAQCPGNIAPVRYHSLERSQIAISVTINHSGPYEFMFDTGAQITVMEPALADELKLQPEGSISVVAVLHSSGVQVVVPDQIEAGGVTVQKPMVALMGLGQIQALNPQVRGILGQNFLNHFDVLIDHSHKLVCLDQGKQMQQAVQGERVPIAAPRDSEGSLPYTEPVLVAVHVAGDGRKTTVLRVDSGTNAPVLFVNRLKTSANLQRAKARFGSTAGNGRASAYTMMPAQEVRIGDKTVRQIAFATPVSDVRPTTKSGEDGLLPTTLFKRVFISQDDHFVMFDPR